MDSIDSIDSIELFYLAASQAFLFEKQKLFLKNCNLWLTDSLKKN